MAYPSTDDPTPPALRMGLSKNIPEVNATQPLNHGDCVANDAVTVPWHGAVECVECAESRHARGRELAKVRAPRRVATAPGHPKLHAGGAGSLPVPGWPVVSC